MLIIKNGLVYDAVSPEAKVQDILVDGAKIVAIGIGYEGTDYNEMNALRPHICEVSE